MNTNGLAKHYGTLTERERLALALAALRRDDDADYQRLIDSAPVRTLAVPETQLSAVALVLACFSHVVDQLETAANYWQAHARRADLPKDQAYLAPLLIDLLGDRLIAEADGWTLFCVALGLPDGDVLGLTTSVKA